MAVTIMCPHLLCRRILVVPNESRGTRVRCSYCGTQFMVPKRREPKYATGFAGSAEGGAGGGPPSTGTEPPGKAK